MIENVQFQALFYDTNSNNEKFPIKSKRTQDTKFL